MLYGLREVSEAVGLSPITLRSYTSRGKSDLVRGVDFIVRRTSPYRRQLMITERGLLRLQARAYRVSGEPLAPSRQLIWNGREKPPPIKGSPQERRMRLKQAVAVVSRQYLEHPCAVPSCPCIVHRLGLPQADVVAEVMLRKLPRSPIVSG
jgi:hypothetical protein